MSFYFLTCPERNSIGMFPIHLGEVVARTLGETEPLIAALSQLEAQGEIVMEGYWIMVPSWWDHNHKPGPGHRERVERALASAPEGLRSQWEAVAIAAGIFPFRWTDSAHVLTQEDRGGTPGPTPSNNNLNPKRNGKRVKSTTTTTTGEECPPLHEVKAVVGEAGGAYAGVKFRAPAAEAHRPAFVRVCLSEGLSAGEASDLADELCARVEQAAQSTEFHVEHHEPWLRAVVKNAREAGAPILRAGAKYRREEEARLKRAQAEAAQSAAHQASQRLQEAQRAELMRSLEALSDSQLAELAYETDRLFPTGTANGPRLRVKAAILARSVPTGMGQALLSRALKQHLER